MGFVSDAEQTSSPNRTNSIIVKIVAYKCAWTTFASELVCPRCGRVEEVGETFPLSTRASYRIKQENVYLKKQVMKFFRNYSANVPDELIRQVEFAYISLQDFYLTATRPSLTFLIPAILDLVLPFKGPLRTRFMLNTIYKDVNTENFTKTQLKTIHIWRSFLEHHGLIANS